ncbi:hypothetical protein ACWT_7214 [Actinoplanes sp. SE50]|uniref:hypothetical protein n=1 Tax=unclassified Actinoplanes TaxID=2626549 RepID=UPI00023EDEC8|nr:MULTISPECIES: hypothetical protein [unclassified Actinoplanes]AEV88224.1 hypothetical protein ACPL_7344 [Actinoplanes sp. SE50/110]ATO86629.1 hypothetical protein ACWT_7214 [Actinoplanes sp. SE50]SLM04046.1 hypothetical protein ACSP50_7345 [Actinoplanes sp. SE50/110]
MERGPRGLLTRASLAAGLFAVTVVPGWTLGDLAERATGWPALDWLITCGWSGVVVAGYAPWTSYRARDGLAGAVPLYGWYLAGVLSWRVALLPFRDWEPRRDELWRARWLTGDLIGFWRADQAGARPVTSARSRAVARRTR